PAALPGWITVAGIAASGRHGLGDEERSQPQPFEVDISVSTNVERAAAEDDLTATVNYAVLQELVITQVATTSFHLLETLAAAVARSVLERWPQVGGVEVAVRKPGAPMPGPFSKVEVRVRLAR
ncbi:MAG TPA: dihydroneopterin aldolase, partial [Candidatus Limnocylindria bacterium]|nr:dihydroneopterin aldolase [Candidatus Limnocylindria bacterium]